MFPFLVLLVIILVFKQWFIPGYIAGGDLWPMARNAIESFSLYPLAWNSALGGGLGMSTIPYLWNHFQYALPLVFIGKYLHVPWDGIVRFGYVYPFLIISIISSYRFGKYFVGNQWAWITSLIYTTNTYSILLIAGGQTGVALAYAFSPYVLLRFIQSIEHQIIYIRSVTGKKAFHKSNGKLSYANKRGFIINGLLLSLLIVFDLRIAYLISGAILVFIVFCNLRDRLYYRDFASIILCNVLVPLCIATLLHLYWILPSVIFGGTVLDVGSAYVDARVLTFFSFADFSHTFAFLHPNWPENIFGKVYFLQPEFLLFPIIAFSSLFFIRSKAIQRNLYIVFFAMLVIVGAFIAKGTSDPFGLIYKWMFVYIPGFVLFRDPTKFYVFIALGYSLLIPITISEIIILIRSKVHILKPVSLRFIVTVMTIVFVLFWVFTIRQAVAGDIKGTLQHAVVPRDYLLLEEMLEKDQIFSRTFWIPSVHRLSLQTANHPALDALAVTKESSLSGVLSWIREPRAKEQLFRWAVQYIVVPIDTVGEMFITDRSYDDRLRNEVIQTLDKIPWLERDNAYTQLGVWKIESPVGHFWIESGPLIRSSRINPISYWLDNVNMNKDNHVLFSETYNPLWYIKLGNRIQYSSATNDGLNEFIIKEPYVGSISVGFLPQQYLDIGLKIGIVTLTICLFFLRFI